jgi:hypothetical protein
MGINAATFQTGIEMTSDIDQASNPRHYNSLPAEPIEFIMLNQMEFWRGNIIKYAARAGSKRSPDSVNRDQDEIKDLKKIIRYAQFRINQLEGRTPQNDGT